MILVQFATDKDGQYTGATKSMSVSVHQKLIELWKRLLTDGLITQVRVVFVLRFPLWRHINGHVGCVCTTLVPEVFFLLSASEVKKPSKW